MDVKKECSIARNGQPQHPSYQDTRRLTSSPHMATVFVHDIVKKGLVKTAITIIYKNDTIIHLIHIELF